MEIRTATLADRPKFLRLWKEYMIEQSKAGGSVLVCDENLIAFLGLFESYIAGSLFGFTLLAWEDDEAVGILLGGESPASGFHLQTREGKIATLWGIYVSPEHRRKGIGWALQDTARPLGRKLGFDTLLSSILTEDPVSNANALNWGAKITEYLIAFPLAESEHGRQRST